MLDELHKLTGETITLCMPNGLAMQFITVIPGTFPISLTIREGQTISIFATAVGIAQLATRSTEDIQKLAQRANRRTTRTDERVDIDMLKAEIEAARSNGYVEAYDRVLTDTGAIAMALPMSQLDRTLVVAVGGLSERIKTNRTQIIKKMRQAIWQLGHSEES
jgi:DNA-binding IclR family transcriptional regulator